mgnify:CR=1 FL=1
MLPLVVAKAEVMRVAVADCKRGADCPPHLALIWARIYLPRPPAKHTISIMASESMSFRDMCFWTFLTLFGTGTFVIYGAQTYAGEVWGISMTAGGFVGMVCCAWPHIVHEWENVRSGSYRWLKGAERVVWIVLILSAASLAITSYYEIRKMFGSDKTFIPHRLRKALHLRQVS